jgi:hypothetical protein
MRRELVFLPVAVSYTAATAPQRTQLLRIGILT